MGSNIGAIVFRSLVVGAFGCLVELMTKLKANIMKACITIFCKSFVVQLLLVALVSFVQFVGGEPSSLSA
jgi:hypothetical protein